PEHGGDAIADATTHDAEDAESTADGPPRDLVMPLDDPTAARAPATTEPQVAAPYPQQYSHSAFGRDAPPLFERPGAPAPSGDLPARRAAFLGSAGTNGLFADPPSGVEATLPEMQGGHGTPSHSGVHEAGLHDYATQTDAGPHGYAPPGGDPHAVEGQH